jgi:hypothetical protein
MCQAMCERAKFISALGRRGARCGARPERVRAGCARWTCLRPYFAHSAAPSFEASILLLAWIGCVALTIAM